MEEIRSYKDLIVWQKSIEMVKAVYVITRRLPEEEKFGLISQIRRSAISIPSNIAEGKERSTRKDYGQFLRIALGSAAELETQLILIQDLYPKITTMEVQIILEEIRKMLSTMIRKLAS